MDACVCATPGTRFHEAGNLVFIEVDTGRNAPHRFHLALVSEEGERASQPVCGSGVDWGLPGFVDTRITTNLQQLLAAGRAPH